MEEEVYMYGPMEMEELMMIVQETDMPLVHTPSQLELWELMVSQVPLMSSALQSLSLHMSPIHLGTLPW